MATVKVKRSTGSVPPTGLTFGELAFVQGTGNTADRLYISNSSSTSIWVGAQIENAPADWTNVTKLATQNAINTTFMPKSGGTFTGNITAPNIVTSFNGLTGAVGGVTTSVANTFTSLQTFNSGISAAGGVTFSGSVTAPTVAVGTNDTRVATTAFVQNEIVADTVTTFNGRTGSVQGVSAAVAGTGISVSGATGSVTITNIGVQSFNGLTGAVGGVTTSSANTFTALQTFNSGISSAGSTFSGIVNFTQGSTDSGQIRLLEDSDNGTNWIAIKAPAAVTSNITLTLPDGDGDAGQVLTTDGSGVLSWASAGAATTATNLAGGATGSLPYQNGASSTTFLADPNVDGAVLTYNNTTNAPVWSSGTGTGSPVRETSPTIVTPTVTTSISTGSATLGVFDGTATTVNAFGAATTLNLGEDGSGTATTNLNVSNSGTKTVNVATGTGGNRTVNIGTGSSGATTRAVNILNTAAGTNTVSLPLGSSLNYDASALPATGYVRLAYGLDTGTSPSESTYTVSIGTNATGDGLVNVNIGTSGLGTTTVNNNMVVSGNLTINGTTTTINSTTLQVDDKLIELAHSPSGATGNDAAVDGGGIQLNSTGGNKTFTWVDSTDAWTSSEHLNLASGKAYYINGTSVLNSTTLGSAVVTSSLTTVGALSAGSITTGFTQITAADIVGLAALDINGGTATSTIVGSDLLIVDDGANGTNRYVTVDNLFGVNSTATVDGGTF